MIKILHLADLHIGMENHGRVDPVTGLHSRLVDYLNRFDEAIDKGLEADVDLVLIAGDIYKSRTPNPTHQREFAKRINRLRKADIPVFILTGNHDISPSAGRAHSIEIFETLMVDGVTIADRPRLYVIETKAGPLQIMSMPWVTRHALLTKEELRLSSFLEVEAMLLNRIENFLRTTAEELDPSMPSVLTVHGSIDGATTGSEQQIMLGKDLIFPRGMVSHPNIDYVAMGHIHKHQVLGEHPPIVYPGSIERIDFGEEREPKGCVIVELEKGNTRWEFVELAARPFVTLHVDIRNTANPAERISQAIEKRDLTDAVVRVKIEALPQQGPQIRTEEIHRQLEAAGVFLTAAVAIDVERVARSRLGESNQDLLEGLTPKKALELYLRSKQTSEARLKDLLEAAEELFQD